ncbi:MAG TPA: hypothetical protein VEC01_09585 [Noviherbaspirillum sp.]|uniref:hypothetical protein n=1 Tax=Noviherbaspirillum sp. TaxID=1926288 RepID=UPI002D515A7B|nr:hypothetical protein [Noviherbaspirillum sp.]HYD95562.1 hypothetical protein [Noviherbaspirillum sp.]
METAQVQQPRRKGLSAPAILILVGTVLLLARSGLVERDMIWQMLPFLPIAFGVTLLATRLRRRAG